MHTHLHQKFYSIYESSNRKKGWNSVDFWVNFWDKLKNLHVKQLEDQPLLEDFPLAVKTLTSYLSNLLILIFLVHHQIPSRHIEQAKNCVMDIQSNATKKHLQFFDLQWRNMKVAIPCRLNLPVYTGILHDFEPQLACCWLAHRNSWQLMMRPYHLE